MKFNKKYKNLFDFKLLESIRYIVMVGGRGSGKSTAMANLIHDLSFQNDNIILDTRYTMASAKNSVISELIKNIEIRESDKFFEAKNNTLLNKITNSQIIFKGLQTSRLNQTAKLKSITDLNIWVIDEAEELQDEQMFDDVDDSIRRTNHLNLIILVLNSYRLTKESFIYKRFFLDKGVQWGKNGIVNEIMYIHTTYLDNWKNLSQSYQKKILNIKNKYPEKYKYNFLGMLRDKAIGIIFRNWEFGNFDNSLQYIYVLDFGVNDPDAFLKIAINKKLNILYVDEIFYLSNQSDFDLIDNIKNNIEKPKDLIIADSAGKKTILSLQQKGLNVIGASKKAGSIVAGIKKMLNYSIVITKRSRNTAIELNNYIWSEKSKEIPVDAYNHAIDAIRYGVLVKGVLW